MLTLSCKDCIHKNCFEDNYPCKVCVRNGNRISDHYKSPVDLNSISTEDLYTELGKRIKPVLDKKLIDIIKEEQNNGTVQE